MLIKRKIIICLVILTGIYVVHLLITFVVIITLCALGDNNISRNLKSFLFLLCTGSVRQYNMCTVFGQSDVMAKKAEQAGWMSGALQWSLVQTTFRKQITVGNKTETVINRSRGSATAVQFNRSTNFNLKGSTTP